jgi:hypothetical protein
VVLSLAKVRRLPAECVKEAVVNAIQDGCRDWAYLEGWMDSSYHDPKTCSCGKSPGKVR